MIVQCFCMIRYLGWVTKIVELVVVIIIVSYHLTFGINLEVSLVMGLHGFA